MSSRRTFLEQAGSLATLSAMQCGWAKPPKGLSVLRINETNTLRKEFSESSASTSSFVLTKPPALRHGDLIALVSQGFAISVNHPIEALDRGVAALQRQGFRVKVMPHARGRIEHNLAGSVQDRAADVNAAFADPDVRMVMGTEGGGGTLELVSGNYLDWSALRRDPKLLCGYSDFAHLNIAAFLRLGLMTLDSSMAVYHWACLPEPPAYGTESFLKVATRAEPAGVLSPPKEYSVSPFEFSSPQDRAKKLRPATAWRCLRPGVCHGPLLAVRPDQMLDLAEAGYHTSAAGHIWCLDVVRAGLSSYERFSTTMRRVRAAGLVDGVKGIVVSRMISFHDLVPPPTKESDEAIMDATAGMDVPILADVDCGHSIPRLTIPNGVMGTLDSEKRMFRIDEPAVTKA